MLGSLARFMLPLGPQLDTGCGPAYFSPDTPSCQCIPLLPVLCFALPSDACLCCQSLQCSPNCPGHCVALLPVLCDPRQSDPIRCCQCVPVPDSPIPAPAASALRVHPCRDSPVLCCLCAPMLSTTLPCDAMLALRAIPLLCDAIPARAVQCYQLAMLFILFSISMISVKLLYFLRSCSKATATSCSARSRSWASERTSIVAR
mgnify:CR=1 FL=1